MKQFIDLLLLKSRTAATARAAQFKQRQHHESMEHYITSYASSRIIFCRVHVVGDAMDMRHSVSMIRFMQCQIIQYGP
jgi:hypothetical protein